MRNIHPTWLFKISKIKFLDNEQGGKNEGKGKGRKRKISSVECHTVKKGKK